MACWCPAAGYRDSHGESVLRLTIGTFVEWLDELTRQTM
jgi:hypothetical protein